ncbi:MAG: ATP-binding cassette domain-containing protein [Steroidobacteraceae bacterium]
MIAFEGVSHAYTDDVTATVAALIDVSLRVEVGECVAVIGPSGCGKSTLLRLAAGLIVPERGRILIEDLELRPETLMQARQRIGYVIQSGGLFPHLSALDNVVLAARYRKRDEKWIEARVAELAELVQLPVASLSRYPKDLSGGQRQRVSLMRALMLDPDVLLLDEPLGALDPMVRHGLQEELGALFARLKKSVLLVTHDMAEAAFFSRHIVLMQAGRIVQQGTYEDLALRPTDAFVSEFVRAQRPLPTLRSGSASA